MNERIKELWDQAAKLEPDPSWAGQTKFMEKFAELIVRECMSISSEAMTNDNWPPHMIAKHFGVEE